MPTLAGDALRGGPGLLEPGAAPADPDALAAVAAAARAALRGFRSDGTG